MRKNHKIIDKNIVLKTPCGSFILSQGFYFYLIIFIFLLINSNKTIAQIPAFRQHPFPENIDVLDTAKNTTPLELNCLAQTPDGILWMGSNRGLIRYNGVQVQLFPTESSVTALFSSAKQGLWLGCANGQISTFNKNKINLWQREEGLPKVKITGFAEDSLGNFWFSTYGEGAYCFDGKHLYNFNIEDKIAGNDIYSIINDKENNMLLATDNGISFCRFINGNKSVKNSNNKTELPDLIVKAFTKLPLNDVFAGFYNGSFGNLTTHNWSKINGFISSLAQFEQNGFVVGTEDNGLFFVDLFHERMDKVPPSVGRNIQAVFKDNEGNIWVISDKNKLFSANCRFIPYKTGLQNMQAITKGTASGELRKNKELLIGTKEGAFNFDVKTGQIQRFLPNNVNVISLFNHFGSPFIGTYGAGLFLKNNYETIHFTEENGLTNLNVFSITTKDDTLWAATLGGIFRFLSTSNGWEIVNYSALEGLSTDFIYKIFEESKHRIWLGTDGKGASLFDGNKGFKHFNKTKEGVILGSIVGIEESPKGTIWLANTEGSLFYGNELMGFTALPRSKNFGHQTLTGMSVDARGNIIVLTNNGIELIHPTLKNRTRFGAEMGLTSFESGLNPFCFEDINNFWCVTSTDLIRMPYVNAYQKTRPSPILRGVKILMQNIDYETVNDFSYSQNYLTFDIEGVWLTNPQAVRCRYKLEGLDPDWQTTKENAVTYPNLPAGHYVFSLQASLSDDFTGADEVTYTFDIAKPIWQQWWFLVLMAGILGGLFYLFVKRREDILNKEAALKQDKIVSQLELLKSQISPHFLFNSFNTLIATIENDPKSAVEFTEHLSDFYRNILHTREKDVITIKEEQELLTSYIFLLQKRHGETLTIKMNLINCLNKKIVPLSLQILVENAVKHNVVSKSRPLSILISETENGYIDIKNNVQKKLNIEVGTGFGLSSLMSRYQLLTGKKVEIIETNDVFLVRIPMI
jgi:ligand-binding sensor domain-containing protein